MTTVLNLVISGIPSIQVYLWVFKDRLTIVLNLVISGIPSIRRKDETDGKDIYEF